MKIFFPPTLAVAVSLVTALLTTSSHAALITVDGINVTNNGTILVADVPQSTLPNQDPSSQFAWLQSLVSEPYNTIASANLPDPTGAPSSPTIQDDNASSNGSYSLLGGVAYYVVSHYGKANTAWYIKPASDGDYGMPNQASAFGGAGKGLSNVRIWRVSVPDDDIPGVPDGGTTLASLGLALLGLGSMRRFLIKKA